MSATTTENVEETVGNSIDDEDVKRTLDELRRENSTLKTQYEQERTKATRLETNLEGERVARTTAEVERDTHATRAASEAEQRWNAEKNAVTSGIASLQHTLSSAEEDYTRHAEVNDWKEAAKAQREMARAEAQLLEHQRKSEWLDSNKERIVAKPVPTQRVEITRQAAPSHRYASYINGNLVGGEEAWLDSRPQFQTDPAYREEVFAATNFASRKYVRGSEPYLREVERVLGENGQHDNEGGGTPSPRQTPGRQNQSADLSPSRRSAPGQQPAGSQQEWHLTEDEKEMADGMYGNPNSVAGWFEPDRAKRYKRYYDNNQLMKQTRGG
jgi:hypothetical protein